MTRFKITFFFFFFNVCGLFLFLNAYLFSFPFVSSPGMHCHFSWSDEQVNRESWKDTGTVQEHNTVCNCILIYDVSLKAGMVFPDSN